MMLEVIKPFEEANSIVSRVNDFCVEHCESSKPGNSLAAYGTSLTIFYEMSEESMALLTMTIPDYDRVTMR